MISTLTGYVQVALREARPMDASSRKAEGPWYRGVNCLSNSLLPGLYWRASCPPEWQIVSEFQAQAPALLSSIMGGWQSRLPENLWDWYFTMQHYGLPTRLLDWTDNPLVALYFALSSTSHSDDCPGVWMLDPEGLNEHSIGERNVILPGGPFSAEWAFRQSPDEVAGVTEGEARSFDYKGKEYTNRLPLCVYPTRLNPRLIAQRGVFTVHGTDATGIETILPSKCLKSVEVNPAARTTLLADLEILGVNRLALFPELPSLSEYIKEFLGVSDRPRTAEDRSQSHASVGDASA